MNGGEHLFDKMKRRIAGVRNQAEVLTLAQLIDLLGVSRTNPREMAEATYFACIRVLSESVGKLPLKIMRNVPGGGVEPDPTHPLYNVLRYRPNPYQSATAFWNSMEQAKHHDGNAVALIRGAGRSTTLWQLPWSAVTVWYDDKRLFGDEGRIWYIYRDPRTGAALKCSNDEVIHLRSTLTRDGIIGMPVRECIGAMVKGGAKAQSMLEKLYDTGFTARAVLQYTGQLSDESEKKLVSKIQEYAEGKVDTGKALIPVPYGMSIQPLNVRLTDAQFDEVRKHTALQIAAAFGIKPHQINDLEKSSYASAEAQQLAFYVDKLLVELKGNEEEITYKALSTEDQAKGYVASFNARASLRTDFKTQMDALTRAVAGGIHTPNEARAMMDFASKPGGDRLYINGNAIPLEMAGQQYQKGGNA